MRQRNIGRLGAGGLAVVLFVAANCGEGPREVPDTRIPVAVLGDSDSHSYHDSLTFRDPAARGGPLRAVTFQWTEIWARLRPGEVDLGPWGTWGSARRIARIRQAIGLPARAPRKQDYQYNLAVTGSRCEHLVRGAGRQVQPLLRMMDRDPARWSRGLVVIRIGINSVGGTADLDAYAAAGVTPEARAGVDACLADIADAVRLIRVRHDATHIALVGIADDANWAKSLDRWQDPGALERIAAVLDLFDDGLRRLAAADRSIVFVNERAWFTTLWGGRDPASGRPAYRAVDVGGAEPVTNTAGDHPRNMALGDGHAGTIANGLWLRELIRVTEAAWDLGLNQVGLAELVALTGLTGG